MNLEYQTGASPVLKVSDQAEKAQIGKISLNTSVGKES